MAAVVFTFGSSNLALFVELMSRLSATEYFETVLSSVEMR